MKSIATSSLYHISLLHIIRYYLSIDYRKTTKTNVNYSLNFMLQDDIYRTVLHDITTRLESKRRDRNLRSEWERLDKPNWSMELKWKNDTIAQWRILSSFQNDIMTCRHRPNSKIRISFFFFVSLLVSFHLIWSARSVRANNVYVCDVVPVPGSYTRIDFSVRWTDNQKEKFLFFGHFFHLCSLENSPAPLLLCRRFHAAQKNLYFDSINY